MKIKKKEDTEQYLKQIAQSLEKLVFLTEFQLKSAGVTITYNKRGE